MATACADPDLGDGPSEDEDEEPDWHDSDSVLSDDSAFPAYETEGGGAGAHEGAARALYEACAWNDGHTLQEILKRGVSQEDAMELDVNGRNGLMVAVTGGFVDIVYGLHACPHIDINHQDYDGNTALMIAAQAGFTTILNYILNYFPGVDTEVRDPRGFTALIKAGLQGREECVSALLMHGADINAVDLVRGRGLKEWILKTGRFETLCRLRRLQAHPIAEQFCESYTPEWPDLKPLVAKAAATRTASQKLARRIKNSLSFSFPREPRDNGVVDHMVRITTSIHSPLVATGCRPLCPTSPPEIGKRRLAVPELVAKHGSRGLEEGSVCHSDGSVTTATPPPASSSSVSLTSCCQGDGGGRRFVPSSLTHSNNSVFPSGCVPKIEVTRSSDPTPKKEKKKKKMQNGYLEPPIWKYKEAKMEKKKEKKKRDEQYQKDKKDKKSKSKSGKK